MKLKLSNQAVTTAATVAATQATTQAATRITVQPTAIKINKAN